MKYLDRFLDRITMYRLLMYYVIGLLGIAMLYGAFGVISYSPYTIFLSTALIVGVSVGVNFIFAKLYKAPSNPESSIITGLILALIITPPASLQTVPFLVAVTSLAIASKYILAINNKHIFNPVAIAVVLTAFGPQESASWWVGSTVLAPFVLVGGLLIVRKIRRTKMVSLFFAVALIGTALVSFMLHKDVFSTVQATILHSSLLFLGFVMLTEPLTSPSSWSKQRWYAIIVAVCFIPDLHIGSIYSTPELALVIGNLASFFMTPRVKTLLHLHSTASHGQTTEDFIFTPERKFSYQAGQYIELTLPHEHADQRGSRRFFTLASSPTEDDIRIGIRFYDKGSTFKRVLRTAGADLFLSAGQLGGDFTLPKNPQQKMTFIAGGIGVTPFRSMIKFLSDTNDVRDVSLLYGENNIDSVSYSDVFEEARQKIGVKTTYVINDESVTPTDRITQGRIDVPLIQTQVPDFLDRLFYISGPQPMVRGMRRTLISMGVRRGNIKVDYFSGYA